MHAFTSHMRRMTEQTQVSASEAADNPLLEEWGGRFGVPAFGRINAEHFRPAFARAFAAHAAEVAAIAGNAQAPTFANTIDALEASGETLARAVDLFHLLAGAHTNDAILAFERELAPLKAKHWDRILMDQALFGRIDGLYQMRDRLALSAEQRRVLERYQVKFTRAGAALDAPAKTRLADVNERLATLGTTFSQNVLVDEQSYALVLDGGGARACRQARHHHFALERRAVPAILHATRPAGENFSRLDRAWRRWRRQRQQGDHCRDGGVARRARAAARLSELRPLPARRYHGENAAGRACPARARLGAGPPPRDGRSRGPAGAGAGGGKKFRARAVGLALLRGEAAQSALRHRRGDDQAVSAARAHHRGRILRREPPVRAHLRASRRRPGVA